MHQWGRGVQVPIFMKLAFWWEKEIMSKINRPLNGAVCYRRKARRERECLSRGFLPSRAGFPETVLFHEIPEGCAVASQVTPSSDLRLQGVGEHRFQVLEQRGTKQGVPRILSTASVENGGS